MSSELAYTTTSTLVSGCLVVTLPQEIADSLAAESAKREAAEVITSEAGAWWELRTLVLSLSEAELFDERAFPALEGESLQQLVQQESSAHWADHIKHFG